MISNISLNSRVETFTRDYYTLDNHSTEQDKVVVIAMWIFSIICPLIPAIGFFLSWIQDLAAPSTSLYKKESDKPQIEIIREEPIVAWSLPHTQFTVISPVNGINPPITYGCGVISTEAALRYLKGQFETKEDIAKAFIIGGMRTLEAVQIPVPDDARKEMEMMNYNEARAFLQRTFTTALTNHRELVLQNMRNHSIAYASGRPIQEAFQGEALLNSHPNDDRHRSFGQISRSLRGSNSFIEESGLYEGRIAAVLTTGGHHRMIGLALDRLGQVSETVFFDSNRCFGRDGAEFRRWRAEPQNPEDPFHSLITTLSHLLASDQQPFSISPVTTH